MANSTYRGILATAVVIVAGIAWIGTPEVAKSAPASCSAGYAYAGVAGRQAAQGLAATISTATLPTVTAGHVAGWVGVGSSSAWIQAGLSSVPGQRPVVYAEVRLPGGKPVYTAIAMAHTHVRYRISVVMEPGERWSVLVNGSRVVAPVHLPGSASWRPVATAETWLPSTTTCSAFSYRFQNVTTEDGSKWEPLTDVEVLRHGGTDTVTRNGSSFLAASS